MEETMHPNLAILNRLDISDLDACVDVFADRFVWHYHNPKLPDLEGTYRGLTGLKRFFSRMSEAGHGTFQVNPVEIRAVGDELVIVQVCNQMVLDDGPIEVDAIVVWRIVDGKIDEAWDIPAVHNVRALPPDQNPAGEMPKGSQR